MTAPLDRPRYLLTSVTRNAGLAADDFDVSPRPREAWGGGDFVVGRVTGRPNALYRIEQVDGRMVQVLEGDLVIGALGNRAATLEGVGDWRDIGPDGEFHALTGAGLFGRATSTSLLLPPLMSLDYVGHVHRDGAPLALADCRRPAGDARLEAPVVLLVGTSMSAGKTLTGRMIIHELRRRPVTIVGAKFTGAARYRDILTFRDAGADAVVDFVDAGLASTVVERDVFRDAMDHMLACVADHAPDIVVAEAGASPLEPYNGDVAIDRLNRRLGFVALAASDPYAVVGVQTAFGLQPNLVTGPATNTSAGVALIEKLAGVPALNLLDPAALPRLRALLNDAFPDLLVD